MAAITNTNRTVVFGQHEQKVLDQLDNCVAQEDGALGVLCADGHFGEAPGAYKRFDAVLAEHAGTVRILHRLEPLGVAMAPGDTRDAYKD